MKPFRREMEGSVKGVVVLAFLFILFPLGYSVARFAIRQADEAQPFLEVSTEKGTECVRETGFMRLHHMELLKEIREEVIREGKRGDLGLDNCRDCHSNRARFCNECHDAVNLSVDCFGCHYYPESGIVNASSGG